MLSFPSGDRRSRFLRSVATRNANSGFATRVSARRATTASGRNCLLENMDGDLETAAAGEDEPSCVFPSREGAVDCLMTSLPGTCILCVDECEIQMHSVS